MGARRCAAPAGIVKDRGWPDSAFYDVRRGARRKSERRVAGEPRRTRSPGREIGGRIRTGDFLLPKQAL